MKTISVLSLALLLNACALFKPVVVNVPPAPPVPSAQKLVCTPEAKSFVVFEDSKWFMCGASQDGTYAFQQIVIQDHPPSEAEAPKAETPKPEPKKKK